MIFFLDKMYLILNKNLSYLEMSAKNSSIIKRDQVRNRRLFWVGILAQRF